MRVHGKTPRSEVQLNANGDVGETVDESVGETDGEKLVKVGENAQCECGPVWDSTVVVGHPSWFPLILPILRILERESGTRFGLRDSGRSRGKRWLTRAENPPNLWFGRHSAQWLCYILLRRFMCGCSGTWVTPGGIPGVGFVLVEFHF